jgi:hypothetical protein
MRTISRHILAGLLIVAAAASVGSAAHFAVPAHNSSVSMSSQTCPQGTNWNNTLCN